MAASSGTEDIRAANRRLEMAGAREIIGWAWSRFGLRLAVTSSFQTQSVPLLHLISQVCPCLPVYFLDTGFHFPETLNFRTQLAQRLKLNVVDLRCEGGHDAFLGRYGLLHSRDPDLCCYLNKVQPVERLLGEHHAWLTGIRRDQTPDRAHAPIIDIGADGVCKIAPLAAWTAEDIERYIDSHGLPRHPLTALGYRSIGCQPCTRPVATADDLRAGRWPGTSKTECGLHENYWRAGARDPEKS